MQIKELPFRTKNPQEYPTLTVRVTDTDRKKKLTALKQAGVSISDLFKPLAYEMIDAAFDKLKKV